MIEKPHITLAEVTLPYRLRYTDTGFFSGFIKDLPPEPVPTICITDEDWNFYREEGFQENAHMEYSLLTAHFSDALLAFDRVIVHAVALRWRDYAYLICGSSGVGKTTQARYLQELRPGEFSVICGDRPILQFCHSEQNEESDASATTSKIIVHPSPWNGKENWHDAEAAPLAGLILLGRGKENRLVSVSEKSAVLPMYTYMIHSALDREEIEKVAELEQRLLCSVPIWKLTSHEVPASTKLLLQSVFK